MGVSKPEQEQIRPKENAHHQTYHILPCLSFTSFSPRCTKLQSITWGLPPGPPAELDPWPNAAAIRPPAHLRDAEGCPWPRSSPAMGQRPLGP